MNLDELDALLYTLDDLLVQATTERSHYYVASRCRLSITAIRELLADNERLRKALQSIADNGCCDRCQEAALVARAALAQKIDSTTGERR
jgi:hypothetical protein